MEINRCTIRHVQLFINAQSLSEFKRNIASHSPEYILTFGHNKKCDYHTGVLLEKRTFERFMDTSMTDSVNSYPGEKNGR